MRSKIGITFFRNGNVNIYDATLSEELWHDYKAFAQLAAVKKQKDTRQGEWAARRYERAAALSLYAFFEIVLRKWYAELKETCFCPYGAEALLFQTVRLLREYAVTRGGRGQTYDIGHLQALLERYERHDGTVWEHANAEMLADSEKTFVSFLNYVETNTELKRFRSTGEQSKNLLDRLGKFLRDEP